MFIKFGNELPFNPSGNGGLKHRKFTEIVRNTQFRYGSGFHGAIYFK